MITALAVLVGSVVRTVSGKLQSLYQTIPTGVRTRIPRGRTVVIGLVAVALLVAAPLKAFTGSASASTHTPKAPAATALAHPVHPGVKAKPTKKPVHKAQPRPRPQVQGVSPEQAKNAEAIAQVAGERGLPEHATAIALATALQESNLKNLNYGDRDSLGLFQQRPSAGWGTPEQIMDPHYSAGKFLDRLEQVPGWKSMPVTVAAQTVQVSAFPDAYAKWEPLANSLASQVHPGK